MLNEQPPERRPHPLEAPSPTPSPFTGVPNDAPPTRTPVKLRIPAVQPRATLILLAINIIVFLVRLISPTIDESFFLWGANNHALVFADGEFYRLLSSMFLHASVYSFNGQLALQNSLHLILNCYIIYITGRQIEPVFGHVRFVAVYLLGGITGSIASALLSSGDVYSVGASGAAFAILGAEFIYLYKHRLLFGARGRAQMSSLISLGLINLAFGLLSSVSAAGARIDNWAHIGGAVGGMILAWLIAPLFLPRRDPLQPDTLIADDANPLRGKTWSLSLYVTVLLVVLIIGSRIV
jgi:rhomboid protease GluP